MVFANCHCHSVFSDDDFTPEYLVKLAKDNGYGAIVLTDHDTVQGYPFMKAACEKYGLKTMIGAEFTTYHTMRVDGRTRGIHLLGFGFDPEHEALRDFIPYAASMQTDRSRILFQFAKESGKMRGGVEWEDVLADHPNHNYFCNNEVFASFMKRGIYRYDEYDDFVKENFSYRLGLEDKIRSITGISYADIHTDDVIRIVKAAGGVPVIAHPQNKAQFVPELIEMGVMGFETRHSMLSPEEHDFYEKVCEEHGLYKMGGADHENVLGGLLTFPDECYDCPYEHSGVTEEDFMTLYERRLG